MDIIKLNYMANSLISSAKNINLIPGGLADHSKKHFNPKSLQKGKKVEMEHTNDPNVAEEIAKDHLTEDKNYYEKLEKCVEALWKQAASIETIEILAQGDGVESIKNLIRLINLAHKNKDIKNITFYIDDSKYYPITTIKPFKIKTAIEEDNFFEFNPAKDEKLSKILNDYLNLEEEGLQPYSHKKFNIKLEMPSSKELQNFLKLIDSLRFMGAVGASRSIAVELNNNGKKINFTGFDGDGIDNISDIKINGIKYKQLKENKKIFNEMLG